MTCNVLISSAGRRVALLECFREALGRAGQDGQDGRVVATDVSRLSSAFHVADAGVLVPRCTSDEFVPAVLEICRRHEIRLVVPTIDTELPVLAAHRDEFAALGITVAVSGPGTVAIGADKVLTHEWLTEHGFPTVRQADPAVVAAAAPSDWEYPLVVKPRRGSASIGVAVVDDPTSSTWPPGPATSWCRRWRVATSTRSTCTSTATERWWRRCRAAASRCAGAR